MMRLSEAALIQWGKQLSTHLQKIRRAVIYLQGPLGAGKTTLARAIIQGLGITGPVKSPTYTLVEEYATPTHIIYHFDCYRLTDPAELDFIGITDYADETSLILIEWPEKGQGHLPGADVVVQLTPMLDERELQLQANSVLGQQLLASLTVGSG